METATPTSPQTIVLKRVDWPSTALVAFASSALTLAAAWFLLIEPRLPVPQAAAPAPDQALGALRQDIERELHAQREALEAIVRAHESKPHARLPDGAREEAAAVAKRLVRALDADLVGVGMAKVAVTEFMLTNGRPPNGNAEIGLPAPETFRGTLLRTLTVGANGAIELDFDRDGASSRATLVPESSPYSVRWRCTTDFAEVVEVMPDCDAGPSAGS